ncbi:MAG: chemotaxis protein methyltransferase CheR [Nitriliruptoraceae bacterium]|jgi:chemotaxis protein methyltransferase CheR
MSGMLPQELQEFRVLLKARSGIDLGDGKEYLVVNRLAPLVRQRGGTLSELLRELPFDRALCDEVIDAMTTNETSFFRDLHPFESLRTKLIPQIMEKNRATKQLRILSGASSTGQEAYSLAMMLRSSFPELNSWRVGIQGIDLSRHAVARAQEARYSQLEINRGLPVANLRYFRREGRSFVVVDELRALCEFKQMNLIESWGPLGPFDLSLMRNVLIYFDVPTKEAILRKLVNVTVPGGVVMLGSSETTLSLDVALTPERVGSSTVFRTPDRSASLWVSPAMAPTS